MRRVIALVAVLVWFVGAMTQVSAHQLKTAVTTMLFNERTQNLEVMHQFSLHDAEHAVEVLFDTAADMHKNEQTRQQFAAYVLERFAITRLDGTPITLQTVGFQVDGADFWVYQETPIPAQLKGLRIRHQVLQDIWRSQQNLLNVEGNGPLQSLRFTVEDDWQRLQFEPSP